MRRIARTLTHLVERVKEFMDPLNRRDALGLEDLVTDRAVFL